MVASIVALSMVAVGCGSDEPEAGSLAGMVRTPALEVASVEVPDATSNEEPFAMKAQPGELLVVYFGYTFCPDICPTTMSDISVALNELPDDQADRVEVALVTVDPDRDTGEVLDRYLGHFFERGRGLRTTDLDQLDSAASAFGVRYEVEDHSEGDLDYEVSHSAVTYVVDDAGTVVVEWPFGMDGLDMAADLATLLTKEET